MMNQRNDPLSTHPTTPPDPARPPTSVVLQSLHPCAVWLHPDDDAAPMRATTEAATEESTGESTAPLPPRPYVIPAKAGIHPPPPRPYVIPAKAGIHPPPPEISRFRRDGRRAAQHLCNAGIKGVYPPPHPTPRTRAHITNERGLPHA